MEKLSITTVNILLFLLPGLIAVNIERVFFLTKRQQVSLFEIIINSLIYTLILNVIYVSLFQCILNLDYPLLLLNNDNYSIQFEEPLGLLLMTICALISGTLVGIAKHRDWPLKILREMNLTKRTYHYSFWYEVMYSRTIDDNVKIIFKSGDELFGYPRFFNPKYESGPVLLLERAKWLQINGQEMDIKNQVEYNILIYSDEIKRIEFYLQE